MNNRYALIGLIALVVAASGCASLTVLTAANASTDKPGKNADKTINIDASGLQNNEEIRKFSFEDGGETINCYVYDQHDGYAGMGGMSCIPDGESNR